MPRMKAFLLICLYAVVACMFQGCATNPYRQFYSNQLGGKTVIDYKDFEHDPGEPALHNGTSPDEDYTRMLEEGHVLIGYSNFNGKLASIEDAKNLGRDLKATDVILYRNFTNTVSGSIPWTVQNPSQLATTHQQGSIYGSGGGWANYYGSSTTSLPGGTTTYNIPYSVNRYDQLATFWTRLKNNPILGVFVRDLNTKERQSIQRNRGVYVIAVRKNSPAFKSDILKGDIIISIDNIQVSDAKETSELVSKNSGKAVPIEIYRGNEVRTILVELN